MTFLLKKKKNCLLLSTLSILNIHRFREVYMVDIRKGTGLADKYQNLPRIFLSEARRLGPFLLLWVFSQDEKWLSDRHLCIWISLIDITKLRCSVHWCHKPVPLRFSCQTQPQWASFPIWRLRNLLENYVYFILKNRRWKDKREHKVWNLVNHYQHLLLTVAMSKNRILSGPVFIM